MAVQWFIVLMITLTTTTSSSIAELYAYGDGNITQVCRPSETGRRFKNIGNNLMMISIKNPPNDTECEWLLIAPEDKLVRIMLDFIRKSYPWDYLLIARDGKNENAVLLQNFTESSLHWFWWVSSTRYLWIKFKIDYKRSPTVFGFNLLVEFATNTIACGPTGENTRFDKLTISSPFYPHAYPNSQTCIWMISPSEFVYIRLKFNELDLGEGDTITNNALTMDFNSNMSKSMKSLIVKKWITPCFLNCGLMFESDRQFTAKGFDIYIKKNEPRHRACRRNFPQPYQIDTKENIISSPFYPEYYPTNENCIWLVNAPQGFKIGFMFIDFDLGPNDYLEICNENDTLLKRFKIKPRLDIWWTFEESSHLLNFRSSKDITFKGFQIKLKYASEEACSPKDLNLNSPEGTLSPFDGFYFNDKRCTWLVTSPQHQFIKFWFTKFDLALPGDFLEIYDDVDESSALIRNFTTMPDLKERWESSGNNLLIRFVSDNNYEVATGFNLTWKFYNKTKESAQEQTTEKSGTNANTQEQKGSAFLKLGVGLGTGFLILVLLVVIVVTMKRKKNINKKLCSSNEPCEISQNQIEVLEEIGQGAFGKVFKGQIDSPNVDKVSLNKAGQMANVNKGSLNKAGQNLKSNTKCIVAIKMLHDMATGQEKSDFLREIEFMKNVGRHKNVVSFVACCTKEDQVFLVVEYAHHGDLLHLLKNKRNTTYTRVYLNSVSDHPSESSHDIEKLLEEFISYSWQISQGMEYLASKGIVHRDLAARNILVADGLVAKVADFGLSRNVTYETKVYQAIASRRLPLRWMSPEALTDQVFTTKSDIWSYGVVLWEIFSFGKLPYHMLHNDELLSFLREGNRLDRPDICPNETFELMLHCWKENAEDRPSFSEIIKSLETLMTRDTPYVDLIEMTEMHDECSVPVDSCRVDSEGTNIA